LKSEIKYHFENHTRTSINSLQHLMIPRRSQFQYLLFLWVVEPKWRR